MIICSNVSNISKAGDCLKRWEEKCGSQHFREYCWWLERISRSTVVNKEIICADVLRWLLFKHPSITQINPRFKTDSACDMWGPADRFHFSQSAEPWLSIYYPGWEDREVGTGNWGSDKQEEFSTLETSNGNESPGSRKFTRFDWPYTCFSVDRLWDIQHDVMALSDQWRPWDLELEVVVCLGCMTQMSGCSRLIWASSKTAAGTYE